MDVTFITDCQARFAREGWGGGRISSPQYSRAIVNSTNYSSSRK